WMPTSEYDESGELYQTVSPFRAYKSMADSMTDHDRLLQTSSRYAEVMRAANDPRAFAALLYDAGYSTDPAYADKLIALMDHYDLYRLAAWGPGFGGQGSGVGGRGRHVILSEAEGPQACQGDVCEGSHL